MPPPPLAYQCATHLTGERIRFKDPSSSSSSGAGGSAQRRLAATQAASAAVIPAAVLTKFADEGYVFRGTVDLGAIAQRTGYRTPTR